MAEHERNAAGRGADRPAAGPPGYGGISEGSVGDPSAAGQNATPPDAGVRPQGSAGASGAREQAARGEGEAGEREAQTEPVDAPRDGGSGNEVIPGVLHGDGSVTYESSAEHKSSWPDEGGTGEAGAG
ncbi:hypothetical protein WMF31_29775 [Sorangium sp. So ce1036]|uniref:hypothetical protein n=1 Tax=Sorangium sp. So ce1036 TaxID=3133328 RepID=UPI003F0AA7AF